MGFFTKLFATVFGEKEVHIFMFGLHNAGKTTILHKLKLGEVVETRPNYCIRIETLKVLLSLVEKIARYKNITFTSLDGPYSAGDMYGPLLTHYYHDTDALILVVDSNDRDQIASVKYQIKYTLVRLENRDAVFLIFANKQDFPNAMTCSELVDKLDLNNLLASRTWYIQESYAPVGDGLYEGMDWLSKTLKQKRL